MNLERLYLEGGWGFICAELNARPRRPLLQVQAWPDTKSTGRRSLPNLPSERMRFAWVKAASIFPFSSIRTARYWAFSGDSFGLWFLSIFCILKENIANAKHSNVFLVKELREERTGYTCNTATR